LAKQKKYAHLKAESTIQKNSHPKNHPHPHDPNPQNYVRPLDIKHGQIDMAHGSGGRAMAQLIEELFAKHLGNEYLAQGDDGALLPHPGEGKLVMATDSHVVSPLFFPGGDIGCLSVHGTINDVAVMGAEPLYLSAGFILEEASSSPIWRASCKAWRRRPRRRGADRDRRHQGGRARQGRWGVHHDHRRRRGAAGQRTVGRNAQPGDVILVSGTLGDHGMAIMAERESLGFESPIVSDTAALHG
jgi:hydrogenase expression/formation protein HypE